MSRIDTGCARRAKMSDSVAHWPDHSRQTTTDASAIWRVANPIDWSCENAKIAGGGKELWNLSRQSSPNLKRLLLLKKKKKKKKKKCKDLTCIWKADLVKLTRSSTRAYRRERAYLTSVLDPEATPKYFSRSLVGKSRSLFSLSELFRDSVHWTT